MKNKMIALLTLTLLLVLGACGGEQKSDSETLKVGMELKWPPFEMTDTNGTPDGISVLIAKELGEYLGREVEIVDLAFGSLIPALETNKVDVIIASMSITEERKEKISFSEPYMYFKILTAVNKDSGIKSKKDLFTKDGVRFVGPKSFSTLELARKEANNPKILEFDDKATASLELAAGNADAFIVDAVTAVSISKSYPEKIDVLYETIEAAPIGMGLRKGDEKLLKKANEFISKMEELGINDKIKESYNDVLKESIGKTYDFYINED